MLLKLEMLLNFPSLPKHLIIFCHAPPPSSSNLPTVSLPLSPPHFSGRCHHSPPASAERRRQRGSSVATVGSVAGALAARGQWRQYSGVVGGGSGGKQRGGGSGGGRAAAVARQRRWQSGSRVAAMAVVEWRRQHDKGGGSIGSAVAASAEWRR
jgi:hypothetical protein